MHHRVQHGSFRDQHLDVASHLVNCPPIQHHDWHWRKNRTSAMLNLKSHAFYQCNAHHPVPAGMTLTNSDADTHTSSSSTLEHLSRNRMYHSKQVISLIKVYVAQWSALRRAHQICTSSCTKVQYKACLTRYNQRFSPGKYLRQNVAATNCQKQMKTELQSRGLQVWDE